MLAPSSPDGAVAQVVRVGTETIASQRVPIYALAGRPGRYVAQLDAEGQTTYVSVEGAKSFKSGGVPLVSTLAETTRTEMRGRAAFALQSGPEQLDSARRLLRALADHLLQHDARPTRAAYAGLN